MSLQPISSHMMRTIFGRSAGLRAFAAVGQPRQIPVTTSSASRIGLEKCIGGRLKRLAKRGQFFQQIAKRLAKPYAQATCETRTAPEPFSPWH